MFFNTNRPDETEVQSYWFGYGMTDGQNARGLDSFEVMQRDMEFEDPDEPFTKEDYAEYRRGYREGVENA